MRWTCLILTACLPLAAGAQTVPLRCADLSSLDELESGHAVFRDQGVQGDALAILKSRGLDTIRLRLFHSPTELPDGLDDMLTLARRARDHGYNIALNLHYSDKWADPGRQTKPAAWAELPLAALRDSVHAYTAVAVTALVEQGTPPVLVQVGNEITTGMLWDTGRVGGQFDTPDQWEIFRSLVSAGIQAVRAHSSAEVMIHIDRGGDVAGARWFFDRLGPLDYDVIGLSYYPWWHGSLYRFRQTVLLLRQRFQKRVVLMETAYPWTLLWNDDQHNQVGLPEHTLHGFPATPEGQADFVASLWNIVPDGICYWAAEWIAAPGFASSFENIALFDFEGEVLPAARVLGGGSISSSLFKPAELGRLAVFPNPVQAGQVTVRTPSAECIEIRIFNAMGRLVRREPRSCVGNVQLTGLNLAPGVYWVRTSDHMAAPFVVVP